MDQSIGTISCDSGNVHIAGASRRPVVAMYAGIAPSEYRRPLGANVRVVDADAGSCSQYPCMDPCYLKCNHGEACGNSVSIKSVRDAIEWLISQPPDKFAEI